MITRRDILTVGGMALLAAGCDTGPASPGRERLLRVALGHWTGLDPHRAIRTEDLFLCGALFKGLVDVNSSGGVTPALARSWNVSADGLTYTFRLRRAQWSDGQPIQAEDVTASFNRALAMRVDNPVASGLDAIEQAIARARGRRAQSPFTVSSLADTVVQIRLVEPLPALLGLLAHPALAVVPAKLIRQRRERWTAPDMLVVNGPFKPAAGSPEGRIELVPNPRFWGRSAIALDRAFLVPARDADATFSGFRDGRLDVVIGEAVPFANLDALRALDASAVRQEQTWSVTGYIVNDRRSPLNQPTVRRALSMALDRQLIADALQLGTGVIPSAAMVPGNLPSYATPAQPDWWTWPLAQRRAEARRLLAEAGFQANRPLDITVLQTAGTIERRCFTAVALQWAQIGVQSRAVEMSRKRLETALAEGTFDLASRSFATPVDMPEAYLARTLCDARPLNPSGYCNPEADHALAGAMQQADVTARTQALQRAEQLVVDETPLITLYADVGVALVAPHVRGWINNPTGRHPLDRLSLDPGAR